MIEKLREEFESKYYVEITTTKGIEEMASKIGVSKNTLRRFLGKIKSNSQLSEVSLNFISNYLGYNNFKDFTEFDSKNDSLDIFTLELFYDSIKNKGVVFNEKRFQDVNRQFAEKIILNERNLNQFLKAFSNNNEALEYVLAWHPTYGKICQIDYQNTLKKYASKSNISHIKVFANSFIFFGKFLSNNLVKEDSKFIEKLEKEVQKMRKEYHFYWAFPEVRFTIAKTLYLYNFQPNVLKSFIKTSIQEFEEKSTTIHERTIYSSYYANALNLIGEFEIANELQLKYIDVDFLSSENYYHSYAQLPFYKVSRAITLLNIGKTEEAEEIYNEFKKLNLNELPFDIRDYVEIQFYILAYHLNKKDQIYLKKIQEIITKTNFQFFNSLL